MAGNENSEKMMKARQVYATMIKALNKAEWHFEEHEEDLTIVSGYTGDDFPIKYIMRVDPKRDCVSFRSAPFVTFPEDKRIDGAVATCVANCGMVFGHFDYDINDGEICYVMSDSYLDCEVGVEFFMDMMATAVTTSDRYNDRFMMLAKGLIDIQKFIELEG